jgi:hydrogenase maturation protease
MIQQPVLLLGLGNSLAGDDGIGSRIAAALAVDPRLPATVEVLQAGSDLLRLEPQMKGRRHIVLLDAMLAPEDVGTVMFRSDASQLDDRQGHAHHLSAVQAMTLLRTVVPALSSVQCTWITIGVADTRISHELSPALAEQVPNILEQILDGLRRLTTDGT